MMVQIVVFLAVAVSLLMPWRLATRRRCEVCRSSTPRRLRHCRFCGATPHEPTDGWLEARPASDDGWKAFQ
jgi:hypothetical protein